MIKNIIFDIGNVLLNFKPKEFMRRFIKDESRIDTFISKVVWSDTWKQLDRGLITLDKAKILYHSMYPEEKDLLEPFFKHCWEMLTPIEKNIKILFELKEKGYNIYVLSDFIKEAFEKVVKENDFFRVLNGKVISSQKHLLKPEKEIYQLILKKYNLNPEECVFIDDNDYTLPPAQDLGMQTIHYTPNTNLRKELKMLGIII
ncbi:MAG: HAD family hydrolase [Promethearchaeota archaeon]